MLNFPLHRRQVRILSHCPSAAGANSWLIRVNLPRVEVDHGRLSLNVVNLTDRPTRNAVGYPAQIPASSYADILPCIAHCGGRKFKNSMSVFGDVPGRKTLR